jgi:hypothetical protein
MYGGDSRSCEVLAFVLAVGWLHNDRTRELAVNFDNVALPAFDALCRDLWALVHSGVVETHSAETRISAMDQVGEFEQRVARLKSSDRQHVNDLSETPTVKVKPRHACAMSLLDEQINFSPLPSEALH